MTYRKKLDEVVPPLEAINVTSAHEKVSARPPLSAPRRVTWNYLLASSDFLYEPRRLMVAMSRAKEKSVLVASRSIFSLFSPDEDAFANAQLWKSLLRRTCTTLLWEGDIAGHNVQVWRNSQVN